MKNKMTEAEIRAEVMAIDVDPHEGTRVPKSGNKKITPLNSVGSGIDENGFVYPQHNDGTFDLSDGVDIWDISASDDWMKTLDKKDKKIINKIVNN